MAALLWVPPDRDTGHRDVALNLFCTNRFALCSHLFFELNPKTLSEAVNKNRELVHKQKRVN